MMEMVVTISIMAILAAVIAVETTPQLPAARAASINQSLTSIKQALLSYGTAMGSYPDSLSKLVAQPVFANGPEDICGVAYGSGTVDNWGGPYLLQSVPSSGIAVGSSVIMTALSSNTNTPPQLLVTVTGVDSTVAVELELQVDVGNTGAAADFTAGNIMWTSSGEGMGRGTLQYGIPFSGCGP
jgi:type II secretory pathway pseudopilin PulG